MLPFVDHLCDVPTLCTGDLFVATIIVDFLCAREAMQSARRELASIREL